MEPASFRNSAIVIALVWISSAFRAGPASGAGFALPVQSASGLGNSFAGVGAAAEDASTVY